MYKRQVVGLSLLKCGRYPNPLADREHHEAVYSVFPHQGDWKAAGTVREAYLLNNPMRVFDGRKGQRELDVYKRQVSTASVRRMAGFR